MILKNELSFDEIDTELSIQVAGFKIGLKAYAGTAPLSPLLSSLNLHHILAKNDSFQDRINCYDDTETDFYWHAKMMVLV